MKQSRINPRLAVVSVHCVLSMGKYVQNSCVIVMLDVRQFDCTFYQIPGISCWSKSCPLVEAAVDRDESFESWGSCVLVQLKESFWIIQVCILFSI